jgi:hypothetical protein
MLIRSVIFSIMAFSTSVAFADSSLSAQCTVESVDTVHSMIACRYMSDVFKEKWDVITAKFGESTKWEDGEKGKYPADPATSAIVQMLHKGSAVEIVALKTDSDPDWALQKLKLLPASKVNAGK